MAVELIGMRHQKPITWKNHKETLSIIQLKEYIFKKAFFFLAGSITYNFVTRFPEIDETVTGSEEIGEEG